MLERLVARFRRSLPSRPARGGMPAAPAVAGREAAVPPVPAGGRHRRAGWLRAAGGDPPGVASGPGAFPFGSPVTARPRQQASSRPEGERGGGRAGAARAALRAVARDAGAATGRAGTQASVPRARSAAAGWRAAGAARLPWHEVTHAYRAAGHRDCGPLEKMLYREWDEGAVPPPEIVRAIDRLAELPAAVKESLVAGIDSIHVGPGGVPDLDSMGRLRGGALPSGRATWDACAGAYGERKIVVGSRPSAAPDVMCHEVGHALDDIDGSGGGWQSDSAEFRALYDRCLPHLASDFHRQEGPLGRREFFADAFSAIASRQRPALVDMLGGNIRMALDVMLYFNTRYRI